MPDYGTVLHNLLVDPGCWFVAIGLVAAVWFAISPLPCGDR